MVQAILPALEMLSGMASKTGSKTHPPTETQVCRSLVFKAVNLLYNTPVLPSIGAIANVEGSKKAKAKLT
jgi:hypothetical protein